MSHNLPNMQQIHPQPTEAQQSPYSKLKVEDALSYLDLVKQQFCTQPQVYNVFLDIMKEFKLQSIDTPGVLSRVSTLFQGHKELIVGFNKFLPVGCKIELNEATNTINIYQLGSIVETISVHTKPKQRVQEYLQVETSQVYNDHMSPVSMADTNQPVEFYHAISFANKIKIRYQIQSEVYKSFLDLIGNYLKQQKLAKEQTKLNEIDLNNETYNKVAALLRDDPDLVREFEQFCPPTEMKETMTEEEGLCRKLNDLSHDEPNPL